MRNLNIKATVSTRPSVIPAHEIPVITRGATAELFYNLTNNNILYYIQNPIDRF